MRLGKAPKDLPDFRAVIFGGGVFISQVPQPTWEDIHVSRGTRLGIHRNFPIMKFFET